MEFVHNLIHWVIRAVITCTLLVAVWWVLEHPQTATHLLGVVLNGIAGLATGIVNAVTGAFS
jgi:hypothetical protein